MVVMLTFVIIFIVGVHEATAWLPMQRGEMVKLIVITGSAPSS